MQDIHKPRHVMCVSVRVGESMRTELLAETGKDSLSCIMNTKVKRALRGLIAKIHKEGDA